MKSLRTFTLALMALFIMVSGRFAQAEQPKTIRFAQQGSITYLPLLVIDELNFFERRAREAGLGEMKVEWRKISGGSSQNDALLSGSIEFASGGVPPFLKLWSKAKGTKNAVVGVIGVSTIPLTLTTRNPAFKTLKDISEKDRIALSAVKISTQALLLQMEAARLYGQDKYAAFDKYTVAMPGHESLQIMLSGAGELTSDFYSMPNVQRELSTPGIHKVIDSEEILGGPGTVAMIYTTQKLYEENPKLVRALISAYDDAVDFIANNPQQAAEIFRKSAKSTESTEELIKMFGDPRKSYAPAPRGFMKFAKFMNKIGALPDPPSRWQDLFVKEAHILNGD